MTIKPIRARNSKRNLKPIWDLYRDGLTQGAINKFLQCREQFYLSVVMGWVSKEETEALAFGSAFHDILAKRHTTPHDITTLIDRADKKARKGRFTAEQLEAISVRYSTINKILPHYEVYWEKEDEKRTWLCREKVFRENSDSYHPCDSSTFKNRSFSVPLRGRFDGVFEKSGLWLLETKTKGQIDDYGIEATLPFDTQTMLYCWAMRQIYKKPPQGIIYDVVRRPMLRRGVNEPFLGYMERIDKDIEARPDHYFKRWKVQLTDHDTYQWESAFLNPVLSQIDNWWSELKSADLNPRRVWCHWINPNALETRYGKCDLFRAITQNNFQGLKRLKKPFPELED